MKFLPRITVFSLVLVMVASFQVVVHQSTRPPSSLNMGWADAFKNDSSLGKAPDAGLTNGPKVNDNVTVNGVRVQGAIQGQLLTAVAAKARVKIPVNCRQGDCGTCTIKFNGRKVKGKLMMMINDA